MHFSWVFPHSKYFLRPCSRYLPHPSSPSRRPWWHPATRTPHRASKHWARPSTPAPPRSPPTLKHTAPHNCHTTATTASTAVTTATRPARRHPPPRPEDGRRSNNHSRRSRSRSRNRSRSHHSQSTNRRNIWCLLLITFVCLTFFLLFLFSPRYLLFINVCIQNLTIWL